MHGFVSGRLHEARPEQPQASERLCDEFQGEALAFAARRQKAIHGLAAYLGSS